MKKNKIVAAISAIVLLMAMTFALAACSGGDAKLVKSYSGWDLSGQATCQVLELYDDNTYKLIGGIYSEYNETPSARVEVTVTGTYELISEDPDFGSAQIRLIDTADLYVQAKAYIFIDVADEYKPLLDRSTADMEDAEAQPLKELFGISNVTVSVTENFMDELVTQNYTAIFAR